MRFRTSKGAILCSNEDDTDPETKDPNAIVAKGSAENKADAFMSSPSSVAK